jgi:hypothetical protein
MRESPEFHPEWMPDENGGLFNPRFGSVKRVVICKDDGSPIYDQ